MSPTPRDLKSPSEWVADVLSDFGNQKGNGPWRSLRDFMVEAVERRDVAQSQIVNLNPREVGGTS